MPRARRRTAPSPSSARALRARLDRNGYAIVRGLVRGGDVVALREALGDRPSGRDLFAIATVRRVLASTRVRTLARALLGPRAVAVRALLIDKRASADWALPWHQDRVVAVAHPREVSGFTAWSRKDGVEHAVAPTAVLERMVALRIHLDACDVRSGALRLLRGSHREGVRDERPIGRDAGAERCPTVRRGDVLVLRPLCLHASARSRRASPRRVVHIEFAAAPLPGGVAWHDRVAPSFSLRGARPGASWPDA